MTVEGGMAVRRVGAGPEVVWIHGLGEQSASFDAICAALPGFTHVLPDLPGYGRSAWPEAAASLAITAGQLARWIGGRRPFLVGHSMGGVLATMIGELVPIAGIVDIDGNLSLGDCTFSAEAARYTLDEFRAGGFDAMRARVAERGLTEPALRSYHAALMLASPDVFHAHAIDLVAVSTLEGRVRRLGAIAATAPVMFIAGLPGGICERSQHLLDAHHIPWAGISPAGHWPFIDQPQLFAAAARAVLTRG